MNRIKDARQAKGLRQLDLAQYVGVSQGTLSHWETGLNEPDIASIKKMCEILEVSSEYLLGLAGLSESAAASNVVTIPVLGAVPAGIPLEAIEDVLDWEEIPAAMCAGGREYFALRVTGDSMWPDYLEGDVVIVRKSPTCESGDVCVVYVNGYDATLKQVKLLANGSLTIVPKNPSYPPRTFSPQEIRDLPVSIAGVVVELRRKINKK